MLKSDKNQIFSTFAKQATFFFENKVDDILLKTDDKSSIEAEIDNAIYKIYGLSENEIQIIESQ